MKKTTSLKTSELWKRYLMLLVCLLSLNLVMAQNTKQVSGIITDKHGETLPGVTIIVDGTTTGTVSDIAGSYSITVGKDGNLVFSFVGMKSQTLNVTDKTVLNVVMEVDAIGLDEIVAIGYGRMKKSDLTGSVASVNEKTFNKGSVVNANQLIQGKTAGVTIFQSNAGPGGSSSIQVRGATSINASSQPLYVVDGMPIDNSTLNGGNGNLSGQAVFTPAPPSPLNTINPGDIESIEILKDASATAIYGSRGANGVVLITTKSGKEGKVEVTYDGSIAIQDIAKEYDIPNSYEYAKGYNTVYDEYKRLKPDDVIFTNPIVKKFTEAEMTGFKSNPGTDWFNLLTRKGVINNHQVSLSSGTTKTKVYASLGYMDHSGVIEKSDMERLSARLNITQKFGNIFEAGIRLNSAITKNTNIPVGSADVGFSRGGATSGVFAFAPMLSPYDEDGEISIHPFNRTTANPAGLLYTEYESESNRMITNAYLQADIMEGLFAKVSAGIDRVNDNARTWVPAEAKNTLATKGEATTGSFTNETKTLNAILQYDKTIKKHSVSLMAGTDYQSFEYHSQSGKSTGFTTSAYKFNNMSSGEVQKTYSSKSTSTIFSYLSRLNYSFDNRYLFTASARWDGSSKFAEDEKWGFFPSAAVAWKMHNESFIQDLGVFSNLKLRASYGETGNQAIGNNNSQPLLGSRTIGIVGSSQLIGIGPVSPGNKNLSWETTKSTNIGADFGFLNNKISLSLDAYRMKTEDLLLGFGTPNTSGFGSVTKNAGSIQNQGFEIAITTQNTTGVVNWSSAFNIAYNEDKWIDRAGLPFAPAEEHGPVRGIYGYKVTGMFQADDDIANSAQPNCIPGQLIFEDVGGRDEEGNWVKGADGKINGDDRQLIGNNAPKFTAGFTNTIEYNDFTLTLFFQGMFGFDINNNAAGMLSSARRMLNLEGVGVDAFDFYRPGNTNTDVTTLVNNPYGGFSTHHLEKGDFVRLKTVNLNYHLPISNKWISDANVYVNIDNALLFTNYSGLDPESARPIGTKSGSENDVYPNSRTFSLGFRMKF